MDPGRRGVVNKTGESSSPSSPSLPSKRWIDSPVDEACCRRLAAELRLSPASARILYRRGIQDVEEAERFLLASLRQMRGPLLLTGMDRAVERLLEAIAHREKVLVYGDYDVDGLTSTAILVRFLRHAGLDPLYHIPDRLQEGYGLHEGWMRRFSEMGVRLIVTVDCGVTAVEAVRSAKREGMDVIITDHHECSDVLPPACAVLNPKLPDNPFPFRDLAGVGVAFYLLVALRGRMREMGMWARTPEPDLRGYLDLVALGTLADMVPLLEENRIFVKYGLKRISRSSRPGVSILREGAGIQGEIKDVRPLVYKIIPRINAPGRLGCAQDALEMLLCEDWEEAGRIARILEERNTERRSIEAKVYREARELALEQMREGDLRVITVAAEGWHKGILGIVASRLARDFHRTVVLVSFEGDLGKGSIRSYENHEFLDALTLCSPFLEDYGGHQAAAGITLRLEKLGEFRRAFERAVTAGKDGPGGELPPLAVDAWIEDPSELNDGLMDEIERMAPFGPGNAEPVLGMKRVRILGKRIVGEDHLKLVLEAEGRRFEAIGFGMGDSGVMESGHGSWDVLFSPRHETWAGRTRLTLKLVDLRPA